MPIKKFTTMLIFFIIFLFKITISSKTIKIKCMKKINSRNKIQYLNVDNFEIILKFLNFDDLPYFLRACEKSKSNYLKQTTFKLFKTFYKKKIEKSIEYMSFKIFHAQQPPNKKKYTKFFDKYMHLKTISLPKFMDHAIQTPQFRIVSHVDGHFSMEQKLQNQKQYTTVSIQDLFCQKICRDLSSSDRIRIKGLNFLFSSKNFICSILNQQNYIFIKFEEGEIFICGKTGEFHLCVFRAINFECKISHFISGNRTYFMSHFEKDNNLVVYHISSGEIFFFENSSLKSILLNPDSNLDYNFFKNNGKSSGFADSKDYLFYQMMTHMKIDVRENSNTFKDLIK